MRPENYLDVHFLVQIFQGEGEGLVPRGVEVFINHLTFVEGLTFHFKFHKRITGA